MCWTLPWTLKIKQVDEVVVPVLKFYWGRVRQYTDKHTSANVKGYEEKGRVRQE